MKRSFIASAFLAAVLPLLPQAAGRERESAADSKTSFWKGANDGNILRIQEMPDGERRFWVERLDPASESMKNNIAKWALEIDRDQMTPEYMDRMCGFGYGNGIQYEKIVRRKPDQFEAVVSVNFDLVRGVENPTYGDTRWGIKLEYKNPTNRDVMHITGWLAGIRGKLTFGLIKDDGDLVRVPAPETRCQRAPIYLIDKNAPRKPLQPPVLNFYR